MPDNKKMLRFTEVNGDTFVHLGDLLDTIFEAADTPGIAPPARAALYGLCAAVALLGGRSDLVRPDPTGGS